MYIANTYIILSVYYFHNSRDRAEQVKTAIFLIPQFAKPRGMENIESMQATVCCHAVGPTVGGEEYRCPIQRVHCRACRHRDAEVASSHDRSQSAENLH